MADSDIPIVDPDSTLQRTHPATIVTRTFKVMWQMIWAVLALIVFGAGSRGGLPSVAIGAIIAFATVTGVGFSWLGWWRFQYGIIGNDLVITEGLLVRKRRTIPIARVHGVNVRADLFMRALGLVELGVQTAGGGANEPEAKIGAIPLDQAEVLRNTLLHDLPAEEPASQTAAQTAAGGTNTTHEQLIGTDPVGRLSDFRGAFGGSESAGRSLRFEHKVPLGRLVIGELTSNRVPIMLLVFFGIAAQMVEVAGTNVIEETASRAAQFAVPALVGMVVLFGLVATVFATAVAVARDFGFTARRFENRIETEAGLLERRQVSIPIRRVQTVRVEQSWLRKALGLVTVHVDTAGIERSGQQGQQTAGSQAMLPVARVSELEQLMLGLLPEARTFPATHGMPGRALRFYLFVPTLLVAAIAIAATGPIVWFVYRPGLPWAGSLVVVAAAVTLIVRALQWKAAGIGTDADSITLESGVLGTKRVLLTRSRIQSLSVRQNPFQRHAGLAALRAVSVTGSSQATHSLPHIDEADAVRIMEWYQRGLVGPRTDPSDSL